MDRRSWPWKKKSSEKTVPAANPVVGSSGASVGNQDDEENTESVVKYVQISEERYAHLSEMEDQVKQLNEKLSTALSETMSKDNLVKQHSKVAEEAVSGWERAEAESMALKNQLESVTLQRLTAEERAAHLDAALKECMKQIKSVKEESEQKLHDVVFAKTKQWEKVKLELEAKIDAFEGELLRSLAENDALSKSIQERSDMLMKISQEKSRAVAEIEVLKTEIESYEREISSLKYEIHIVSKELEIRNEENNMSVRSAEVANKQHLEDVKKITKLEAECQRLRGLVRKKLPGPAALAQMKREVENLGSDYGEDRLRRSPAKSFSPRSGPAPDFALETIHQLRKENEFLTARLLETEEEIKILKVALSKRNSELQASRNMFAKTCSKLRSIETEMLVLNQQKCSSKSNGDIHIEGSLSQNESNLSSLTSMSEDGIDDEGSCFESWSMGLIPEVSHFRKEKVDDKYTKTNRTNNLELMDDFLEMERLACLTESNGTTSVSRGVTDSRTESMDDSPLSDAPREVKTQKRQHPDLNRPMDVASCNGEQLTREIKSDQNEITLSKFQSEIAMIFESHGRHINIGKLLEGIKHLVQQEKFPQHSVTCVMEEVQLEDDSCDQKHCPEDVVDSTSNIRMKVAMEANLREAISQIHDFVTFLDKETIEIQGGSYEAYGLGQKIREFSSSVDKFLSAKLSVCDFILALSYILTEAKKLSSRMVHNKNNGGESKSPDYIDKVTLLENKVVQHEPGKDSFGRMDTLESLEDFKQLKLEKDSLVIDLAKCNESVEQMKCQLIKAEQQLTELQSQLAASQNSNSLAETQLKCMAESNKSLESRCLQLETEINMLETKAEALENELQEERSIHQDDLVKYKDLQEQMERKERYPVPSYADAGIKTKKEIEITEAAEKLAECQETILLLSRQLKAMHPQADLKHSSSNGQHPICNGPLEGTISTSGSNPKTGSKAEVENIASILQKTGGESPIDGYSCHFSPSGAEASPITWSSGSSKRSKHRSSWPSSSPSNPADKQGRSFTRFFSKGRKDK